MKDKELRFRCRASGEAVNVGRELASDPSGPPPAWNKYTGEGRDMARAILLHWFGEKAAALLEERFQNDFVVFLPGGDVSIPFEQVHAWALKQSPVGEKLVRVDTTRVNVGGEEESVIHSLAMTPMMVLLAIYAFILACVMLMGAAFLGFLSALLAFLALRVSRVFGLRSLLREKGYEWATVRQAWALSRNAAKMRAPRGALRRLPRLDDLGPTPAFDEFLLVESLTEALRLREEARLSRALGEPSAGKRPGLFRRDAEAA